MTPTKLSSLIIVAMLLLTSPSRGIITDPEINFIRTPDDVAAEYGIIKKDEIIRLELDLTGDGQPTVFLAYKGTGSRGGAVWTAYSPTSRGYMRADGLQFRMDFVRAGKVDDLNPKGGLLVLYPGKGAGNLVRYNIDGTRTIREEVQKLDYSNPDHQQLFEQLFGRRLDAPMPDEFFKKTPYQVIEVKAIETRASTNTNDDTSNLLNNDDISKAPANVQTAATKKPYEAKPTVATPNEEASLSIPWSLIVMLIVAALSLMWLLLKKYSRT